ncbi:MAG: alkaline phosphatase family protein [bacterium]|nr:alkaline phosphatase family protein [bacterium]
MKSLACAAACAWAVAVPAAAETVTVEVPADRPFVETGVTLRRGEPFRITASGEIEAFRRRRWSRDGSDRLVGPRGTYNWRDSVANEAFPLAAAERGPAPCYCLIGRIGGGEPFYVGADHRGEAAADGPLSLGVNDFDFSDNTGSFTAEIAAGDAAAAPRERDDVVFDADRLPAGGPVADANVVLIYVDGLRPDVLREMALGGHLPVIREIFFDAGTEYANAFAGFPSSTLPSNATMYTGLFPNRLPVRENSFFDRHRLKGDTFLQPFGPPLAADRMRPVGLRRLWTALRRASREDEIPLLQDHVARAGMAYYSTVKPVLPYSPPDRYEVDASTVVPPFMFHRALDYVDRFNTRYGHDLVIQPDARVMNYWLPGVDHASHNAARAQFGGSRRAIAALDPLVARIIAELERKRMRDRTYLILFADHGTAGGKSRLLQKVDIGRDLFHKPLVVEGGAMAGGSGMGWNVRWFDDSYLRKGPDRRSFVSIDHGEGECAVYLPFARIDSGDWRERNGLRELMDYGVSPGRRADLVERILSWDLSGENLYPEAVTGRPVRFVLARAGEHRAVVFGQDGAAAVIERRGGEGGSYLYRYLPVTGIRPDAAGGISFEETADNDPFGYIAAGIPVSWLGEFRGEREWLERTKYLEIPDGVTAVAHQLFWDGAAAAREARYSPDMVLVAAPGWSFEPPEDPSGGHGCLDAEAVRIPLLVAGPNVRPGAMLADAVRTADIVPTVLSLLGIDPAPGAFDGRPLPGFLAAEGEEGPVSGGGPAAELLARIPSASEPAAAADIVADYDRRREEKAPSFLHPDTRYVGHDLERATDLHIVGAHVLGLLNREIFTDLDNLFDLAHPGERKEPFNGAFDALVRSYDRLPDRYPKERLRELIFALQIREVTLGEAPPVIFMSVTGLAGRGVLFRAQLLIRFLEHLLEDMDAALLAPVPGDDVRVLSNANYVLHGVRESISKISWGLAHYVGKALYDGVYAVEKWNEKAVRAARGQ